MFQLTIGNNWNSIMYPNISATSRWYALYFVAYHFCCTTILVAIITSVVIDGFQVSKERAEQVAAQEQSMQRVLMRSQSRLDEETANHGMSTPLLDVVVKNWQNQVCRGCAAHVMTHQRNVR